MSKPNPVNAKAGNQRRSAVTVDRKGFLKHVATLQDRGDQYFNGLTFKAMTRSGAMLTAWGHAQRIVDREAAHGFDYSTL